MDKNCFSHHKNWVQKIKNQNSSNTPKVNNNQDFLKKKFLFLFLFFSWKKNNYLFFFICTWVLTLLFQLSILFSKLMKFKKKKNYYLVKSHGLLLYKWVQSFFFIKNIPPFARKNTHPLPHYYILLIIIKRY